MRTILTILVAASLGAALQAQKPATPKPTRATAQETEAQKLDRLLRELRQVDRKAWQARLPSNG